MNHVWGKLVFGPFVPVRPALINQHQIGNIGFGVCRFFTFSGCRAE
jgi:hypothetical protein